MWEPQLWPLDHLCGLMVRVYGYRSRSPGFDSQRYQIFWEVLEQGPLSLVSITEELLEWQSSGSGSRKPRLTAMEIHVCERLKSELHLKVIIMVLGSGMCLCVSKHIQFPASWCCTYRKPKLVKSTFVSRRCLGLQFSGAGHYWSFI
jgi:hypothetical protein